MELKVLYPTDFFQLEFEATVGDPGAGDIAIDTLHFQSGPCPRKYSKVLSDTHEKWGFDNFF